MWTLYYVAWTVYVCKVCANVHSPCPRITDRVWLTSSPQTTMNYDLSKQDKERGWSGWSRQSSAESSTGLGTWVLGKKKSWEGFCWLELIKWNDRVYLSADASVQCPQTAPPFAYPPPIKNTYIKQTIREGSIDWMLKYVEEYRLGWWGGQELRLLSLPSK